MKRTATGQSTIDLNNYCHLQASEETTTSAGTSSSNLPRLTTSLRVDLGGTDCINVQAIYSTDNVCEKTGEREMPFMVLALNEPVTIQRQNQSIPLSSTCVMCILFPYSVSYYQFTDAETREVHLQNLMEITAHGLATTPLLFWQGMSQQDQFRYLQDVTRIDSLAAAFRDQSASTLL
jgi:hypothetical protein